MDRELLEYLEGKFSQFEGRFSQLEEKFENLEFRLEGFREEASERFDRLEGKIRQSHVLIEDVRSDVKGVAEGVVAVREGLTEHREQSRREREDDKVFLISLFRHVQESLEAQGDSARM